MSDRRRKGPVGKDPRVGGVTGWSEGQGRVFLTVTGPRAGEDWGPLLPTRPGGRWTVDPEDRGRPSVPGWVPGPDWREGEGSTKVWDGVGRQVPVLDGVLRGQPLLRSHQKLKELPEVLPFHHHVVLHPVMVPPPSRVRVSCYVVLEGTLLSVSLSKL